MPIDGDGEEPVIKKTISSSQSSNGIHSNNHLPMTTEVPPEEFDMRRVGAHFRKSVVTNDNGTTDVDLGEYIEAYNELNKMFPRMGRLFGFIASDVGDKTHILSNHLLSDMGDNYRLVSIMMDYEKSAGIFEQTQHLYSNGSRTLLRLHRALIFVVKLIDGVRLAEHDDKMAPLVRKAYDETLAKFHPWLVRQGVHVAIYTLPNRQQLIFDIAGSKVSDEQADEVMRGIVDAGQTVYDVLQSHYQQRNLLNLP